MFTLTKDGNLSKDGKETKPKMTVQEFMDAFGVSKRNLEIIDESVFYDVDDSFYGIPCKVCFSFCENEIMDIQLIISTEPFLDKCGDDEDIQDVQREECLKLIEKNIKYKEKETGGKRHVMYRTKDTGIRLVQWVMQAELSIKIDYLI